jgi:hypothetical protein
VYLLEKSMTILFGTIAFLLVLVVLRQRLQLPNPGHVIGPEHLRPQTLAEAAEVKLPTLPPTATSAVDARRAVLDSVLADYVSNLRQGDVDDSGYHRQRLEDALNHSSFTRDLLDSWDAFSDFNWQLQPYGLRAVDPAEYEQLTGVKLPLVEDHPKPWKIRGVLAIE